MSLTALSTIDPSCTTVQHLGQPKCHVGPVSHAIEAYCLASTEPPACMESSYIQITCRCACWCLGGCRASRPSRCCRCLCLPPGLYFVLLSYSPGLLPSSPGLVLCLLPGFPPCCCCCLQLLDVLVPVLLPRNTMLLCCGEDLGSSPAIAVLSSNKLIMEPLQAQDATSPQRVRYS